MKKNKNRPVFARRAVVNYDQDVQALKILESAWNNLPRDISYEEREIFYELSAEIVKLCNKMKKLDSSDKN